MKMRGGIPLSSPSTIFPPAEDVELMLSNSQARLFQLSLPAGTFADSAPPSTAKRWIYTNRLARSNGGLRRFEIGKDPSPRNRHHIKLKGYGPLDAANEATMTFELVIGDDLYCNKATWKRSHLGWKLTLHDQ